MNDKFNNLPRTQKISECLMLSWEIEDMLAELIDSPSPLPTWTGQLLKLWAEQDRFWKVFLGRDLPIDLDLLKVRSLSLSVRDVLKEKKARNMTFG